ncbi:hypothetical protein GOP47_0013659 [Adiantum capillus-veneris]|uniref:GTP cyclohydrolase II domain-containing protein n=1 Tax=Adiantum capillus-veneris TaxID=13818 RepID=A0A9D4ZDF9_ADICA|nr:hypothetical protein GOP47_0013659 [Adiantum capillus-veneris]
MGPAFISSVACSQVKTTPACSAWVSNANILSLKECWSSSCQGKFHTSMVATRRSIALICNAHKASDNHKFSRPRSFAAAVSITEPAERAWMENVINETVEPFPKEFYRDPDCPTEGFMSIPEAVKAIQEGKFVIVVDDEDRENEGDLIMAASKVTPSDMSFLVRHSTGIVCVAMKGEDLDRLKLPLMVNDKENEEALRTAFTVSVDAKEGVTTGVSASDRATTILALASRESRPEDLRRPGHIFPLRYREGGVLKRAGHTEASVDLAIMAGLPPVGVLCEIVDERDGSMARLPQLQEFAAKYDLPVISIVDIVRYKRRRETLVERTAVARLPTKWGNFDAFSYRSKLDGIEHIALVKGSIGDGHEVLVRVHSECLTGDIFGSARCDCGPQLSEALQKIEKAGRGVVVYLRGHEGRGIGLGHKLRAYNLQDKGRDTVEANVELGLPVDSREYGIGAQILRDLGVKTIKLMTNNPAKYRGLKGYGLAVSERIPLITPITKENQRYIETKRVKLGHIYGSELSEKSS